MPRGRDARFEAHQELILQAAAALFAQRGYPATSMNQVAQACGLSKATLYHYFTDKYALLLNISLSHVERLRTVVLAVEQSLEPASGARETPPALRLRALITALVREYADAQNEHRVLTEDVRFLLPGDREQVMDLERGVVAGISRAVAGVRPELAEAGLAKPLTMLLFGMINWTFTWMKPQGRLDHEALAPIVADLFLGGLGQVNAPGRSPLAVALPGPHLTVS